MAYFPYHAVARRLIAEGKLIGYRIVPKYHGIAPALLLFFEDTRHPVMPIRAHRFDEYFPLIKNAPRLDEP